MRRKKGQVLDNLGGIGIGIASLAITLTIAFLIMTQGKTQVVDIAATVTNTNESILSWTNNTQFQIATSMGGFNVIGLSNGSSRSGEIVSTDCYTTTSLGLMTIITEIDGALNCGAVNESLNITYSHKPMDIAYNGTTSLQNATDDIPGWVPLIVIAIIGGILLSLVALFRRR